MILSVVDGVLLVLLIERKVKPFKKAWALPGGFKRPEETLDEAARRELHEETGVEATHASRPVRRLRRPRSATRAATS